MASPFSIRAGRGFFTWLLWLPLLYATACTIEAASDFGSTVLVDYSVRPDAGEVAAFDTAILDAHAKVDLSRAKVSGTRVLAYLSAVEVAPEAPYRERLKSEGLAFHGKNPEWNSDLVDVSSPKWAGFLAALADEAVRRGFDGFFLDTMDSVDLLAEKNPSRAATYRDGLVNAVREIRKRHPDKALVVNRGFSVLESIRPVIDGLLAESLFQTWDASQGGYKAVPPRDTEWLLERLNGLRESGLPVLVVDYVSPEDEPLARETADRIASLGFVPLVTTPALKGWSLAPLRLLPRKIAVLYGRKVEKERGDPRYWPADTWTCQSIQLPLEWMGFRADYFNVVGGSFPELESGDFAGVVIDAFADWPPYVQKSVVEWFFRNRAAQVPVLIFGRIPLDDNYAAAFGNLLGLDMDPRLGGTRNIPRGLRVDQESAVLQGEIRPRAIPFNYFSLVAPADAKVHISAAFSVPGDSVVRKFDAVFTAPWGAVALNPFIRFERPDNTNLWVIEPFAFLKEALRPPVFPAPDPTTRDGLRFFFSHVDADGFSNFSAVEKGRYSSEIIRDQIYKRYPLPITSSIIESEIRGFLKRQKPGDAEILTAIARDIFRLPNIQAASHTYSHPFFWMADDKTTTIYEVQALELGVPYDLGEINPVREIRDSVEYMRKELVPEGKPVDLILWSGNCRPGPDALRVASETRVENLNGGDTIISRTRPGLGSVAPWCIPWEDELQIFTAIQNEMLFTNGFQGPRWGGYTNVLKTFEKTGSPRRLKPVGIYYHMFMGDRLESLNSLKTVYDWAISQPLQAGTASSFARSVRDARESAVFTTGPNRWIISHGNHLRTVRIADHGLRPDFRESRNLTGFHREGDQLYISLGNSPTSRLVLAENPAPHIFLESSTAAVNVLAHESASIRLEAEDFRPVRIVLAGLLPGADCKWTLNGQENVQTADEHGRLLLETGTNKVSLEIRDAPLP